MASIFEDRRSADPFDPGRPLSEEVLREIVRLASLSPSANNLQPWRLVAVRSEAAKRRLYEVSRRQARILAAPVTLVVVGDGEGWGASNPVWDELAQRTGDPARVARAIDRAAASYGASPETRTRFAHKNAALFAMSLMLAATSLGVDSHPMDGIDAEGVAREFGLRPGEQVVMLIALGTRDAAEPMPPRRWRRPYGSLVEEV